MCSWKWHSKQEHVLLQCILQNHYMSMCNDVKEHCYTPWTVIILCDRECEEIHENYDGACVNDVLIYHELHRLATKLNDFTWKILFQTAKEIIFYVAMLISSIPPFYGFGTMDDFRIHFTMADLQIIFTWNICSTNAGTWTPLTSRLSGIRA